MNIVINNNCSTDRSRRGIHHKCSIYSRRTVFPVTVKKSSSVRARSASSNMSLVMAWSNKQHVNDLIKN